MPKLTHPDSRHVIERADEDLSIYTSQGWRVQRTSAATKKTTTARKTTASSSTKTTASKGGSK